MKRSFFFHLAVSASAFSLGGCLSGAGDETAKRTGPLYSCIGVPGYGQGTMDSLMADLKNNHPVCVDGKEVSVQAALPKSPARPDTQEIHVYLMDNECHFIKESVERVAFRDSAGLDVMVLFDGKDGNGKSLPTGEYYLNTVYNRSGTAVDTAYGKFGFVKDRCSP
ncbi:MAG: hypothetical protein M3Y08_14060 [Fibrobacterota bacterium]|nr:hypothetical protein [Fibrobacterota bacterium]